MNKVTYAEALKCIGISETKQNRPIEYQDNLNDNARCSTPEFRHKEISARKASTSTEAMQS